MDKSQRCAIKMRGIPYSTKPEDISHFFKGTQMIEDSVRIGRLPDGKLTGEACVLFPTPELARIA